MYTVHAVKKNFSKNNRIIWHLWFLPLLFCAPGSASLFASTKREKKKRSGSWTLDIGLRWPDTVFNIRPVTGHKRPAGNWFWWLAGYEKMAGIPSKFIHLLAWASWVYTCRSTRSSDPGHSPRWTPPRPSQSCTVYTVQRIRLRTFIKRKKNLLWLILYLNQRKPY